MQLARRNIDHIQAMFIVCARYFDIMLANSHAWNDIFSMNDSIPDGIPEPALVHFALSSSPIIYAEQLATPNDLVNQLESAFETLGSDTIILGIRASLTGNILGAIQSMIPGLTPVYGITCMYAKLQSSGYRIVGEVACLPSLDNARFLFRVDDHQTHTMLLHSFLIPRRYSLGILERVLLRCYVLLANILRSPKNLYRGLFIEIQQCSKV